MRPAWWAIALVYPAAALVFASGLWMLWGARVGMDQGQDSPWAAARWRDALTMSTRTAIGLTLMFVAYHAAAYASPRDWPILEIPPDRWWIVAAGAIVTVGASLSIDRLERDGRDHT